MVLDDHSMDTVLSFVRDVPARGSCKKWASHIYTSMQLESKIRVMKRARASGSLSFDYIAARDLGPEITETIAFHFKFFSKGHYNLQFCHTMQGDLADVSVDMSGSWYVERGEFVCKNAGLTKSYEPYCEWHGCEHLRLSKPAVRFSLPIDLVLAGSPGTLHEASCALRWEDSIRSRSLVLGTSGENPWKRLETKAHPDEDEDASYVEVDGRRVQVCRDICENYPEASWANLMSVRIRVGLV